MTGDPTKTTTLRRRFSVETKKRYSKLGREAQKIVTALPADVDNLTKLDIFRHELHKVADRELLSSTAWSEKYINTAAERGAAKGFANTAKVLKTETLEGTGAPSRRLVVASRNNVRNNIVKLTDDALVTMERTFMRGLAEGKNAAGIGKDVRAIVSGSRKQLKSLPVQGRKLSILKKADMLADTGIAEVYNHANIEQMQVAGIRRAIVIAELVTAGDHRVCPVCAGLEGRRWPLEQLNGIIPVHPKCRCLAQPVAPT